MYILILEILENIIFHVDIHIQRRLVQYRDLNSVKYDKARFSIYSINIYSVETHPKRTVATTEKKSAVTATA